MNFPGEPVFIAYGDQRFTDPVNTKATDQRVRKWRVKRIADEKPAAIVLNGDVPLSGDVKNDHVVFHDETQPLDSDTSLLAGLKDSFDIPLRK
jgi:hypothetical protein